MSIYPSRDPIVNSPTKEAMYFGDFRKQNTAVCAICSSCSFCITGPSSNACFNSCFFRHLFVRLTEKNDHPHNETQLAAVRDGWLCHSKAPFKRLPPCYFCIVFTDQFWTRDPKLLLRLYEEAFHKYRTWNSALNKSMFNKLNKPILVGFL